MTYRAQRYSKTSGTWQYIATFQQIEEARSYKDRASRVTELTIRIVDENTNVVY